MKITNEMDWVIENCLKEHGVPIDQIGYSYIKDVIILQLEYPEKDLKELVDVVGDKYNIDGGKVYSSIKYAVKKARLDGHSYSPKKLIITCVNQVYPFARQKSSQS